MSLLVFWCLLLYSLFPFLIFLIWVFSPGLLLYLAKDLPILMIFSKIQLFVSLTVYIVCVVSFYFTDFILQFDYIFPFTPRYNFFSSFFLFQSFQLCYEVTSMRSFHIFFAGISMNLPLRMAFIVSHMFQYVKHSFSLNFRKSYISFLFLLGPSFHSVVSCQFSMSLQAFLGFSC